LGAGTGFLCTAAEAAFGERLLRYHLQEVPVSSLLQNLEQTISQVRDSARFRVIPGMWGEEALTEAINGLDAIDYVLLSDCFYAKKNFAPLVSTLDSLLQAFPQAQIFCAHHQRKYPAQGKQSHPANSLQRQ
jgi:predicted nicotinamide N-methyase